MPEVKETVGMREKWGCLQKRNTKDPMVTELFFIFTVAMSINWLWYCSIDLQNTTIGENWIKVAQGFLWIVSNNCMRIYNDLKIKFNLNYKKKRARERSRKLFIYRFAKISETYCQMKKHGREQYACYLYIKKKKNV